MRRPLRALPRYTLFQMPELVLIIVALVFARWWLDWQWSTVVIIVAVWVAKDVLLFPLLWRAYDTDPRAALNTLVGRRGTARDRLSPHGYVVIHGELWEAEVIGGKTVEPGSRVQVREMRGLTLLVEPDDGAG